MAGEDQVVRIENGIPVKRTVEDNLHTYSNDASAVAVGDVVYQDTASDTKVGIADADNASARPPIGVVSEILTTTSCVVCHFGGIVTGLSGLTRGSKYWLTTTGTSGNTLTTTEPTTNKYLIGVALSATKLLVTSVPSDLNISSTYTPALEAYYNGGKVLENSSGEITRDNSTSWYATGISVQSHISEGDVVGVPELHNYVGDTILANSSITGTPYDAQNSGFPGSATIGASNYTNWVIPDEQQFCIVIRYRYGSNNYLLVRAPGTNGGLVVRCVTSTAMTVQVRDSSDVALATATTGFSGIADNTFLIIKVNRDTRNLDIIVLRPGNANPTASATWPSGDIGGLGTIDHHIGGGNGLTPYAQATNLILWYYNYLPDTADLVTWFDDQTLPLTDIGNPTIIIDGVRLGVELDSSPTDPYPIATGSGANVTAEDSIFFINDDGSIINGAFQSVNFTGDGVYVTDAGGGQANIEVDTLSYSENSIWIGTVKQSPQETETDYFDDSSLDLGLWTEWDVSTTLTPTETSTGLVLTKAASAAVWSGLIQSAPSFTNYTVTAEVEFDIELGKVTGGGILIGNDLITNPSTAAFWNLACAYSTGTSSLNIDAQAWNNYNSAGTVAFTDSLFSHSNRFFIRIFVNTSTSNWQGLISRDGRHWIAMGGLNSYTGTISTIGFCVKNASGTNTVMYSKMFRVDETSDPYLSVGSSLNTSEPSYFLSGPLDVTVSGGDSVNYYGYNDRKYKLAGVKVFSVVPATVGTYTFSLKKGASGFTTNLLSAATFDLTSLTAYTPTSVATITSEDLIFEPGEVWRAQFVSNNAGLDAEGVYFSLIWMEV